MNKKVVVLSATVVCIAVAVALFFVIGRRVKLGDVNKAEINYDYDSVLVDESLTKEETETITDIFENNFLYSDNPSCGFSQDISIVIDNDKTFCIARDTCGIIYWKEKDKYFKVSDEDIEKVHKLFENHGGKFPCV